MSKRKPGRRRPSQSQQGEPDDVFIARVLDIGQWARANQQLMTVLAVLVVIGVAGVVYYGNYRRSLNAQAASQLEGVHQSIAIDDVQGARDQLVTFLERFSGTAFEGEARLLLGELYLSSGQAQQAIAVLAPLGAAPREPIELQGGVLLAKAYEQDERWEEAQRTYLAVADRSELQFQIEESLASAARIRAAEGDVEGALQLYGRLLEEIEEDNPLRGHYQMRIAELRAAATT